MNIPTSRSGSNSWITLRPMEATRGTSILWCRAPTCPVQGSWWAWLGVGPSCRAGQKPSGRVVPPVGPLPKGHLAEARPLFPWGAANWRVRNNASLPSKPCHVTANFAGKAFSAAGQSASLLYVMPILQVYQAKLLKYLDEGGPDPEVFKELHAMDLALRATKVMARAISCNKGNLVVLDRRL